jgi:formylglycine-generating enzyme required for sulfatase activity
LAKIKPDSSGNTTSLTLTLPEDPVTTGSRSTCQSAFGAYDMVGNLYEWVADWVPRSTTCGTWSGSTDSQCLAGAATTGEPGALLRGGNFSGGTDAGPLSVNGIIGPSNSISNGFGFRCAR